MLRSASVLPRGWLPVRSLAALFSLAVVAGCGSGDDDALEQAALCPATNILNGAGRVSAYLPGEAERSQTLRYVAAITGLESSCRYGEDGLTMDLRFPVVVEPGPAFTGDAVDLDLFVATVGPDGAVLGKEPVAVALSPARGGGAVGEVVDLTLTMDVFSEAEARDRRLFVGFQLPRTRPAERPEQLLR